MGADRGPRAVGFAVSACGCASVAISRLHAAPWRTLRPKWRSSGNRHRLSPGRKTVAVIPALTRPVDEIPMRILAQQALGVAPGSNQPSTARMPGRWRRIERGSGCSIDQSDNMPTQANENGAMTLGRAGAAALHRPPRRRIGEGLDGLHREPRITRHRVGDQHFQSRVAGILKLLPVGAVHDVSCASTGRVRQPMSQMRFNAASLLLKRATCRNG